MLFHSVQAWGGSCQRVVLNIGWLNLLRSRDSPLMRMGIGTSGPRLRKENDPTRGSSIGWVDFGNTDSLLTRLSHSQYYSLPILEARQSCLEKERGHVQRQTRQKLTWHLRGHFATPSSPCATTATANEARRLVAALQGALVPACAPALRLIPPV